MEIEKWQAACRAAGIEKRPQTKWGWGDEPSYPPLGDPATVLAIQERLEIHTKPYPANLQYKWVAVGHAQAHEAELGYGDNPADAIIECAAAMEEKGK